MVAPGAYFDIDPGRLRAGASPYAQWMRFSYGPPRANVELGLSRLAEMLASASRAAPAPG